MKPDTRYLIVGLIVIALFAAFALYMMIKAAPLGAL